MYPQGALNPGSLFYFVLPESGTCLPLWRRWPGGAGSEGVSFRGNPTPVSAAGSVGPKRCPPGTRTPLAPPKGVLSSGSPFYFVFLGSETCLPLWGRCHAGGVTEGVSSREVPTPVSPAGSVGPKRCPPGTRTPLAPPISGGKQELSCSLGDFAGLGVTHPLPPPVRGMSGEEWIVCTGGGAFFLKIKFFQGAPPPPPQGRA